MSSCIQTSYYRETCRLFHSKENTSSSSFHSYVVETQTSGLSRNKRFRNAQLHTNGLADVVAEATNEIYQNRIQQLKLLKDLWAAGEEVVIQKLNVEDEDESSAGNSILNYEEHEQEQNLDEQMHSVQETTHLVDREEESSSFHDGTPNSGSAKLGLTLPTRFKMRGRPKGVDLTVIGLPKKKKRGKSFFLTPFCKLHVATKKKIILSWIVYDPTARMALKGYYKVEAVDIHDKLCTINNSILDDAVNVALIRPYLDESAWNKLLTILKKKRKQPNWKCQVCSHSLEGHQIACDHCLQWFHLECVDLVTKPKATYWFCKECRKRSKEQSEPSGQKDPSENPMEQTSDDEPFHTQLLNEDTKISGTSCIIEESSDDSKVADGNVSSDGKEEEEIDKDIRVHEAINRCYKCHRDVMDRLVSESADREKNPILSLGVGKTGAFSTLNDFDHGDERKAFIQDQALYNDDDLISSLTLRLTKTYSELQDVGKITLNRMIYITTSLCKFMKRNNIF